MAPAAGMNDMRGMYGPYSQTRESSGTSWQPDAAAHDGYHTMRGGWMLMAHGFADLVYTNQGGRRGDEKLFGANMIMGMAQRPLGRGTFGLRAMLSAEPSTIGASGYPLLLQTGETADGRTPLIDAQHPHDGFMEFAFAYSVSDSNRSAFAYFGLPGEPALGPPAFMHRFSGLPNPEAPISHHWLDSTHITFGVATLGIVLSNWKLEGSLFTGREPDEQRYGWDSPQFDSRSARLSFNPTPRWSLQASFGRLESPEQLESDVDADRTTVSATYHRSRERSRTQLTIAWGRNDNRPGETLDAWLAEAATELRERHTLFTRIERVEKNELFEDEDLARRVFTVGKATAGYVCDVVRRSQIGLGIGGSASVAIVPGELEEEYGSAPFSGTAFLRARLRSPSL